MGRQLQGSMTEEGFHRAHCPLREASPSNKQPSKRASQLQAPAEGFLQPSAAVTGSVIALACMGMAGFCLSFGWMYMEWFTADGSVYEHKMDGSSHRPSTCMESTSLEHCWTQLGSNRADG